MNSGNGPKTYGTYVGRMEFRTAARLGRPVSVIGLGTWQLGSDWGKVSEADARAVLEASLDAGVTFYDTADVYGSGRSESIIGGFLADHRGEDLFVATKMGRAVQQEYDNFTLEAFREWVDGSRTRLGVDRLDLVQLHCPPTTVIEGDRLYDDLDVLVREGSVAHYGVSVETVDQALSAIARPGVASIQVILNAFRLKPLEQLLPAAKEAGVAIIARVPLASGMLSGRYTKNTTFADDDHRTYNRNGEAFDIGETFSGVAYETGVDAAREFAELANSQGLTAPVAALGWLAQLPGVTTVIPGARNVQQARANASAGSLPPLDEKFGAQVRDLYDRRLRAEVHGRW
jgi:aryl-alcohol dehydrogenase-like predicted oxidoreductase